jgi:hypothetical protein
MNRSPVDRACAALLRALKPHAGPFTLVATSSRPWASATFIGARHRLAIALEGEDAAARATRLQATLSEADVDFHGGFVADILVTARLDGASPVLGIEALTIDEPEAEPVSAATRRAG